jgi:hypothetical protein
MQFRLTRLQTLGSFHFHTSELDMGLAPDSRVVRAIRESTKERDTHSFALARTRFSHVARSDANWL